MTGRQKLKFKQQETAHEMELALDSFYSTLEPLEEYVGKADYYSDWDSRRQIYRKVIKDSNDTVEGFEDLFLTDLFCFKGQVRKKDDDFMKKIKVEFYKWIDATRINVDNCPERLKHFIYEISEVLEGRGEKIVSQTRELVRDTEPTPKEALGMFGQLNHLLNVGRERAEALEGKKWNDKLENEERINGNSKRGKEVLKQICQDVAPRHSDFDLYSEQKKVRGIQSNDPQQRTSFEIVQYLKNFPQNWRLDEIITQLGDYYGRGKVEEWLLIRQDALLDTDTYDNKGKLKFINNHLYRWENFNARQRFEIKKALNIKTDYSTSEEIKWVVKEFKENPKVWEIGEIENQIWLVHNSAQIRKDEIGTLIHNQQMFSEIEWTEINGILERVKLIDNIKQQARLEEGLWVLNRETGEVSEGEDWYIHNQLEKQFDKKTGYLVYVPNGMIRAKDLTETEQMEVGYKQANQTQIQQGSRPQGGGSNWGLGGTYNLYIAGSVSIISLIGLAFIK